MADIRDEFGNPIKLTDLHGNPVQLTDEQGKPMHLHGVAVSAETDAGAKITHEKNGTGHTGGMLGALGAATGLGGAATHGHTGHGFGTGTGTTTAAGHTAGTTTGHGFGTGTTTAGHTAGTGLGTGGMGGGTTAGHGVGTGGTTTLGAVTGLGGATKPTTTERTQSSSSSSSEDDGQGGRIKKKKGLKEKIKDKFSSGGKHKEGEDVAATGGHQQPGHVSKVNTTVTTHSTEHEKKSMMEKIKEKLPGHHAH